MNGDSDIFPPTHIPLFADKVLQGACANIE